MPLSYQRKSDARDELIKSADTLQNYQKNEENTPFNQKQKLIDNFLEKYKNFREIKFEGLLRNLDLMVLWNVLKTFEQLGIIDPEL